MNPWGRFATVARGGQADQVPVALIVDSPWLPDYAGLDTLDYYLQPGKWLQANLGLLARFPDVAWIPGFWVEYGMAAEPSAFGARIVWHHDRPPSNETLPNGLAGLADLAPADPQHHGMMPLVLQLYGGVQERLAREGIGLKMVAARGPFFTAGALLGITELMIALKRQPKPIARLLDVLTDTIIAWLQAQLDVLREPEGILLLDDIPGMLSPKLFDQVARPRLARIFDAFNGLIKVYHNDTPCMHLVDLMAEMSFDVLNFSHEMDIAEVQARMPGKALMGNVSPLSVMVRGTPEEVARQARECIRKTGGRGLILSAGGGVSPGTRAVSIDALVAAARSPGAN